MAAAERSLICQAKSRVAWEKWSINNVIIISPQSFSCENKFIGNTDSIIKLAASNGYQCKDRCTKLAKLAKLAVKYFGCKDRCTKFATSKCERGLVGW